MTFAQRQALIASGKGALALAVVEGPPPYTISFSALQKETLGVYGTPADGWDALYNPLLAAEPAHTKQLDAMNGSIQKASFTPGEIQRTMFDPVSTKMVPLIASGDAQIAEYQAVIPPTVPGASGGGGGGSKPGKPTRGGGGGGIPPGGAGFGPCTGFPTGSGEVIVTSDVRPSCGSDLQESMGTFAKIKAAVIRPFPPKWGAAPAKKGTTP
jgi:hypothetical protein